MTTKALATHTPGPWTDLSDIAKAKQPKMALVSTPHARKAIDATDSGINYEESCANACLIAAAPDLLQALKQLSMWCDENLNGVPSELGRIQELADAAIRKAKGE